MFVCGFRGDWKALREVFRMDRHYNVDKAMAIKGKLLPSLATFYINVA